MLPALLAVQILTLLALVALLLRRSAGPSEAADPRLAQLLDANLPSQLARLDARAEAQEQHLRSELAQMRSEAASEATRSREAAGAANAALRGEVLANISTLGETQRSGLESFRTDNT